MCDDWIKVKFFDKIFVEDWPLNILDHFVNTFIVGEFIDDMFCEIFDPAWINGTKVSNTVFRKMLLDGKFCGKSIICRNRCTNRPCFTAGRIKQILVTNNFAQYSGVIDDEEVQHQIVSNVFDKLSFGVVTPKSKTRIGVLFSRQPELSGAAFASGQNRIVLQQLSSTFYVSVVDLLPGDPLKFVKDHVDTVVVIADAGPLTHLDTLGLVLTRAPYLSVFLLKTTDTMHIPDNVLLDNYRAVFPRNRLLLHDWSSSPTTVTHIISKTIGLRQRLSIAIRSFFVH